MSQERCSWLFFVGLTPGGRNYGWRLRREALGFPALYESSLNNYLNMRGATSSNTCLLVIIPTGLAFSSTTTNKFNFL
jgi:hypothetical protein